MRVALTLARMPVSRVLPSAQRARSLLSETRSASRKFSFFQPYSAQVVSEAKARLADLPFNFKSESFYEPYFLHKLSQKTGYSSEHQRIDKQGRWGQVKHVRNCKVIIGGVAGFSDGRSREYSSGSAEMCMKNSVDSDHLNSVFIFGGTEAVFFKTGVGVTYGQKRESCAFTYDFNPQKKEIVDTAFYNGDGPEGASAFGVGEERGNFQKRCRDALDEANREVPKNPYWWNLGQQVLNRALHCQLRPYFTDRSWRFGNDVTVRAHRFGSYFLLKNMNIDLRTQSLDIQIERLRVMALVHIENTRMWEGPGVGLSGRISVDQSGNVDTALQVGFDHSGRLDVNEEISRAVNDKVKETAKTMRPVLGEIYRRLKDL